MKAKHVLITSIVFIFLISSLVSGSTIITDNYIKVFGVSIWKPYDAIVARYPDMAGDYVCQDSDCSDEIQSAIDYVESNGGGTVFIKSGVYPINNTIYIGNNTMLKGNSRQSAIVNQGNSKMIVNKPSSSNIVITDLYFDGGGKNYAIIDFSTADNVRITMNTFTNVGSTASVAVNDGTNFIISNNIFAPPFGGDAIYSNNAERLVVYGNEIDSPGDTGVAIDGSVEAKSIVVSNNIIKNNGQQGIALGGNVNKVTISSNIIYGGARGIRLDPFGYPTEPNLVNIVNNILTDLSTVGIELYENYSVLVAFNRFVSVPTKVIEHSSATRNVVYFKNIGYATENYGTNTFSGDGVTQEFYINHGLVSQPTTVVVTPVSLNATGDFYVSFNDTTITIHYVSPPPSGTDNIILSWYATI